jgi:MFS family permease
MVIPILPFYAERLGIPPALVIFLFGLYSFGNLIGAPIWGATSDRVGRRPILLATLAANAGANMLLAVATNGWLLAVSRLVSGLAAGNISTAYAVATDVTDEASRPRALGLLGAAFGFGFIVGPALGGLLAGTDETQNLPRVAHAAAIMSGLAFVATLFFLPESHGAEHRAVARAAPRSSRWQLIRRPMLGELLVATLVVVAASAMMMSSYSIWGAVTMDLNPRQMGWIFGYIGVLSVLVQGGAIAALTRRFGQRVLVHAGVLGLAVSLAMLPFLRTPRLTLIPMGIFALGSAVFGPTMSALVAGLAAPSERGAVMGAFQGMSSLGRVVGPLAASGIAAIAGLDTPFLVGAATALVAAWLLRDEARRERAGGAEAVDRE